MSPHYLKRWTCSTFVHNFANPLCTVATTMKSFKFTVSSKKLKYMTSETIFNLYITFGLHSRCPLTSWKVHLQHFCTILPPCGHSGHYNDTLFKFKNSIQYNCMSKSAEGSFLILLFLLGCIHGVPPPSWKGHLQHFCASLQPRGHSGHYNEKHLNPKKVAKNLNTSLWG